jgi:hypothetical protein
MSDAIAPRVEAAAAGQQTDQQQAGEGGTAHVRGPFPATPAGRWYTQALVPLQILGRLPIESVDNFTDGKSCVYQ